MVRAGSDDSVIHVAARGTTTYVDVGFDLACSLDKLDTPPNSKPTSPTDTPSSQTAAEEFSDQPPSAAVAVLDPSQLDPSSVPRVHSGFKAATRMIKEQVLANVADLVLTTGRKRIIVSGHSLGGAIATLLGLEIARTVGPLST